MPFEPLHNTKPDGIAFAAPDHNIIQPEGTPTIPVKFDPSPLNDVAVRIPVTTAPVFVVSNFLLPWKCSSAPLSELPLKNDW